VRRFFSAMVQRPIAAIVSGMTLIGQRLPIRQLIDGSVSRFVYALIRPVSNTQAAEIRRRTEGSKDH